MTHILIVGKSFSGIKDYLSERGYEYTVLQDKLATKFPDKRFKNRVVADFSSKESLLRAASTLNAKKPISGLLTTYENYITAASQIAAHLGLPAITEESARACTDKEMMRELFSKSPTKISPDYSVVKDWEDVQVFANNHDFPLIIKPANLSKSLLVTKSTNLEELRDNYTKTVSQIDQVYKKYAPNQKPKLLIEEFLEGPIYSVDAFVDSSGEPHVLENVVDYQTGYDIGFDDNFHYSRMLPSKLDADRVAAIRQAAAAGCRALGMTSSPAHVEIIYTSDGPRVVEIGARNGGYRERMHWLANGIDITANALALSLNQPLDISPKKNEHVGVFEIFPKTPGIFKGINNQEKLEGLASLKYLSIKANPGQFVGKAGDGYKMCAVVILHSSDSMQFELDAQYLKDHISVQADISN